MPMYPVSNWLHPNSSILVSVFQLFSVIFSSFGAKFMSCGLGFVYNNEMDDFSAPGITNEFGLLPSPVNFIKPGKRPQSSAVPAIILDKDSHVNMVVGGAGGTIITTAVANVSIISYFGFLLTCYPTWLCI